MTPCPRSCACSRTARRPPRTETTKQETRWDSRRRPQGPALRSRPRRRSTTFPWARPQTSPSGVSWRGLQVQNRGFPRAQLRDDSMALSRKDRIFARNDLFFPDVRFRHSQTKRPTDATATTEKALPSPATSLGRVDGRRSLDSVLSNTSVFGGAVAAAAGAGGNTGSVASSPGGGALSSRASLDSARGSADVRALLWRASMPGKCLLCRYVRAGLGESARKAVNIARERKVPQGLTWQKEPKLSSPRA